MTMEDVLGVLERCGAVIKGHFVYTSGLHGSVYINKDAISARVRALRTLCEEMAVRFSGFPVEVVAGAATGGIALAQHTAFFLQRWMGRELLAVYAEKMPWNGRGSGPYLGFRRGYGELISGRQVLIVEDIITTGGTAREMVKAVMAAGGIPVGVGALITRGGVTAEELGVVMLKPLLGLNLSAYGPEECPLCQDNVPVNTDVGHGKEFVLAQESAASFNAAEAAGKDGKDERC